MFWRDGVQAAMQILDIHDGIVRGCFREIFPPAFIQPLHGGLLTAVFTILKREQAPRTPNASRLWKPQKLSTACSKLGNTPVSRPIHTAPKMAQTDFDCYRAKKWSG